MGAVYTWNASMFEFTLTYEAADVKQLVKHCKKLRSWKLTIFRISGFVFIFLLYSLIGAWSDYSDYDEIKWNFIITLIIFLFLLFLIISSFCSYLLEISLDFVASLGPVAMRVDEWGVIHDQSGFKSSVPWHKFYRHVENSTHIMLFMAPRVGIIIKKSDLPEGQVAEFSEFVRQHLPATALSAR